MTHYAVELPDIVKAAERIRGWAHRTPVATCQTLNRLAGRELYFKCEQLQKAGAFKFRGACNAVRRLSEDQAQRGVVTHSSGNHAGALALAAKMRGIPAYVVMPTTASAVKRRAVEEYGGKVIPCEPNQAARESTANAVMGETGANLIPPYNHADVIAGQGTATMELLEDVPDLDAVIAPVGGGGLISGTCLTAKAMSPRIRVFAGEPLGADDAARSKAAGQLVPFTSSKTIADGLLTSLGDLTWPVVRDLVESIWTVSDEEIIRAMRLCWERAKLLIEPSSAVPVAAVLGDGFRRISGVRRVGIILSGGNVDLDRLPWNSSS